MTPPSPGWKPWGDHPLVVGIVVATAMIGTLLAVVSFVRGDPPPGGNQRVQDGITPTIQRTTVRSDAPPTGTPVVADGRESGATALPERVPLIVGRWEHVDDAAVWYRFAVDGTWIGTVNGTDVGEGTYTMQGDTLALQINGAEGVVPYNVVVNTDRMVWLTPTKVVLTFKRVIN